MLDAHLDGSPDRADLGELQGLAAQLAVSDNEPADQTGTILDKLDAPTNQTGTIMIPVQAHPLRAALDTGERPGSDPLLDHAAPVVDGRRLVVGRDTERDGPGPDLEHLGSTQLKDATGSSQFRHG